MADGLLVTRKMLYCGLLSSTKLNTFHPQTRNWKVETVAVMGCWRPQGQAQTTSRCPAHFCSPRSEAAGSSTPPEWTLTPEEAKPSAQAEAKLTSRCLRVTMSCPTHVTEPFRNGSHPTLRQMALCGVLYTTLLLHVLHTHRRGHAMVNSHSCIALAQVRQGTLG